MLRLPLETGDVFVSVSSLEHRTPVYHKKGMEYYDNTGHYMVCGEVNEANCYEIPLRHAEKFARPCLNCFRELRA